MYFSGNMLDEYQRHLETLSVTELSEIVGEDADPVEKAPVTVAGMITSVTVKNTKNGERMAFFTLEDRMAEIECVVFSRAFGELAHLIRKDSGVSVTGTLSLREDEPPKILVRTVEELIENNRFDPSKHQKPTVVPVKEVRAEEAAAHKSPTVKLPSRLFLRVPDAKGELYLKAWNLAGIFEGDFPLYFYYADEKRYEITPIGISMSDYLLKEFKALLGDENVILK